LSHWRNFVWAVQGLKHAGSAPGPETTFGPAKATVEPVSIAAPANSDKNSFDFDIVFVSSEKPHLLYFSLQGGLPAKNKPYVLSVDQFKFAKQHVFFHNRQTFMLVGVQKNLDGA
jgi:hypothetical protein